MKHHAIIGPASFACTTSTTTQSTGSGKAHQ